jgi:GNAT superfamily N-acetyltransferase
VARANLAVRDLSPSEARSVTPLHRTSFAGTMGVALGERYVERMLDEYLSHSEGIGVGAFAAKEPVAYVFGAPAEALASIQRRLLPHMVLGVAAHPRVLAHRHFLRTLPGRIGNLAAARSPVAPRDSEPTFALVGIGVHPAARGRGLGKQIIQAFTERVFARGHTRIILDVYETNTAALRLYENAHWTRAHTVRGVARYELRSPAA